MLLIQLFIDDCLFNVYELMLGTDYSGGIYTFFNG